MGFSTLTLIVTSFELHGEKEHTRKYVETPQLPFTLSSKFEKRFQMLFKKWL